MKTRKIAWFVIFSIFIFSIVLFSSYLFQQKKSDNQPQSNKEFLDFLSQKKSLPQVNEGVTLIAVGDISYSRGVERIVKKQKNINYPFLKIQDYLKNSDILFGNLETPITRGPEIPDFEMTFRSNPGTEKALKQVGFSILSLANNHTMNYGEKGLEDTFNYLEEESIKYVGAGQNEQEAYQPVFIGAKGIKFAFLAYNDTGFVPPSYEAGENHVGTAFMRVEKMVQAIKVAKQKANFVIVSIHSGTEYADTPNNSQTSFAHAAIDAGADLIIGHHPHVVQTVEKYKEKYIFYSLGNFVLDQMWSQETKEGLIIKVYFTKDGIHKISLLPVFMENFAQPRMANKSEAEKILKRLKFSLDNQSVYYWNSGNNDFNKESRGVIYMGNSNDESVVFKQEQSDLNHNSFPENYFLENGRLAIMENSKMIWQSPADWWIDNFVLADSNNDGVVDINLSLWKTGNFGASKPFWVKENDMSIKNHFFVVDYVDDTIKQIWGSSNLSEPNCEFQIEDVDNDGKNDLIVIEGDYLQKPKCSGSYVAVWKWKSFGFSNEWRSEKGNFFNLEIEKIDGKSYMLVDSF